MSTRRIALLLWWIVNGIKTVGMLLIMLVTAPVWLPIIGMERLWDWVEKEVTS